MKFTITMKTPDALDNALDENFPPKGLDEYESFDEIDERHSDRAKTRDFLERFFRYGEYLTIEFDTVAETAVVCPR